MTDTIIELSEHEFAALYPLRTNHLNPTATWANGEGAGCLFETYGEELAFVHQQDPRTVWTLTDGDDGDQYVLSGLHFVNRVGYLISKAPIPEGSTIQVSIPMQTDDDAEAVPHTPGPWSRFHGEGCTAQVEVDFPAVNDTEDGASDKKGANHD